MRFTILTISILSVCSTVWAADQPMNEQEQVNYSLGYELGKDLKGQELHLSEGALLQGVKDALEGNRPQVDARKRLSALNKIRDKRADEQLAKSQAYLAENTKKEGVVTLPSGLQYKVIKSGEGKKPSASDSVQVHYLGTLIDGVKFDSSYDRGEPASFKVNRVIKGWTEALQLMQEGAKWELVIPPDLAYGKRGRSKRIPPNSALIFEVELLKIN